MTEPRPIDFGWSYFNGGLHGGYGPDGYVPPKPMTLAYCWACGPLHIPGFSHVAHWGQAHWGTGFKSAPWRIGRACDGCSKEI